MYLKNRCKVKRDEIKIILLKWRRQQEQYCDLGDEQRQRREIFCARFSTKQLEHYYRRMFYCSATFDYCTHQF